MQRYANLNGYSNVYSYSYGSDYIDVCFYGGSTYRYTYGSCGINNVENMKMLADRGYGLASYIHNNCKYGYSQKW